jgi:hypothetical protein
MVANFGKTVATVYDALWFSDQYIEETVLHKLAAESGLYPIFSTLSIPGFKYCEGEH